MKPIYPLLCSLAILFCCNFHAVAQDHAALFSYNAVYEFTKEQKNIDLQLINGPYFENRYINAKGHPFLYSNKPVSGEVIFQGLHYNELQLMYDCYEQNLIVYSNVNSSIIPTIIPKEHVHSFALLERYFEKLSFNNDEARYYQVLVSTENLRCLYYHHKTRSESSHKVDYLSYEFSDTKRKAYLFYQGQLQPFRNNRSFVKILPENNQKQLLGYLKTHQLKVRKASDEEMKFLIQFSESLLQQNPLP